MSENTESSQESSSESGAEFQTPEALVGLEKFLSVDEGESGKTLNWEQTSSKLASSYKELQSKLGQRTDDIRKEVLGELEAKAPKSIDAYELIKPTLPEDVKLPEGYELKAIDESDPLVQGWRELCFEHKLPKEVFEKGINLHAAVFAQSFVDPNEVVKELGENAEQRMELLNSRMEKMLGAEAATALKDSGIGFSAPAIQALEKLVIKAIEGTGTAGMEESSMAPNANELREQAEELQRSQAYIDRDPVVHKKVSELYAKIYGGKQTQIGQS